MVKFYSYSIDYEYGKATFVTPVSPENALERFYERAGDCFGIRKSIGEVKILEVSQVDSLPTPWNQFAKAVEFLTHHGDVILWDKKGKKIKSEWD